MITIKLREDVLEWREVEGEIVALDLPAREYVSVNRTGAAIWPLLVQGATDDQLAEELVAKFGIDHEVAVGDAAEFVAVLAERGLVDQT